MNELIPELTTTYQLSLVEASAGDGFISTTPNSGASINSSRSISIITVPENDFPNGVFQFSTTPPSPGEPFIPEATSVPVLDIQESAGSVTVYVVRAQGTSGAVGVEYSTEDGSAVGGGISPDYTAQAAALSFTNGEQVQNIQLQIIDDSIPEVGKQFFLNLSNPSGCKQSCPTGHN